MNLTRTAFAGAVLALAAASPAMAHESFYTATLLGSSAVPAVNTPGTGTVLLAVDLDEFTMRVQAAFGGLLGTTLTASLHCCAAAGANGGAVMQPSSLSEFPSGVASGSYDYTFEMALASSYSPAFLAASGGTAGTAFTALLSGLDSGTAYLDIQTTAFPGAEIRGSLVPVPELSTLAMMLAGLGAFAARAVGRARG